MAVVLATDWSSAFALGGGPTSTTLTVTAGGTAQTAVASGTVVTMTATVTAGGSAVTAGQVLFCDAAAVSCKDIHVAGSAQLTSAGSATVRFIPAMGAHSYKAVYVGTTALAMSSSGAVSLTVTGTVSGVSLTSSGSAGSYTLASTVSGSGANRAPTGTVSFQDTTNANYVLGSSTLTVTNALFSQTASANPTVAGHAGWTAVGDFNGDGKADVAIATVNVSGIAILLGHGDGTFTTGTPITTPVNPDGIVVGDFNEDGIQDLAISSNYQVNIYLGHGDGTFSPGATAAIGSSSFNLCVADFNLDGHQDLAVANQAEHTVSILLGQGNGAFTATAVSPAVNTTARDTVVGDFNGDGIPDLAVSAGGSGSGMTILLGNGDGTFTSGVVPSTGPVPFSLAVADFNGDGKDDLAVADDTSSSVTVLLSNGDGTFTPASAGIQTGWVGIAMTIGDFNGDGKADLAVANEMSNTVTVGLGNGDGTFVVATYILPTGSTPFGISAADFNGDGLSDLAVANNASSTIPILLSSMTQTATTTLTNVASIGTGNHQIQASYSGDAVYGASTSSLLTLAAQPVTTTLTLGVSPATSQLGQQVALTATLAPYTAQNHTTDGQIVTFSFGTTTLGTASLQNGVATLNTTSLPLGTTTILASFSGDANFSPSSGLVFAKVRIATAVTLTSPSSTMDALTPLRLTATLSPYSDTGSGHSTNGELITFSFPPYEVTAPLSGGVATFNQPTSLEPGTYTFVAKYATDQFFGDSTSTGITIMVNKAPTSITWAPPASATYTGRAFTNLLTASSTTPGTIVYTVTRSGGSAVPLLAGTVLAAGSYTLTAALTPTDSTYYANSTVSFPFSVTPATLTVAPANATRGYGDANPTLSGTVTGGLNGDTFTAVGATTATPTSPLGSYDITYTVNGTNIANYTYTPVTGTLTVTQGQPKITWATPAPIVYGTKLNTTQLNATASVPGTILYNVSFNQVVSAGTSTLIATFTPTDTTNYATATATVQLVVSRAPLTIVPVIASREYGAANPPIDGSVTGAVAGNTFTVTGSTSATTASPVGVYPITYAVAGDFLFNYTYTPVTGSITVTQVPTSVTWTPPAGIAYGTPLSAAQLNATASVPGTFVYQPQAGAILGAGTQTLGVTFLPTDSTNYKSSTGSTTITVAPGTLTVVPANATRAYGAANPVFSGSVTGAVNGDTFTVTGATAATSTSVAGTYPITYTVTGASLGNYTVVQATGTLTVTQAQPVLSWKAPASIQYGTALSAAQLNASSTIPGTITYQQTAGTVLGAGSYTLTANFVPTDTANYGSSTATVPLTVTKAPLTITANNINRTFGSTNPAFTGTVVGGVNGDTFVETFSTPASLGSIVGSYPILPAVSGSAVANYTVTATNGVLTVSQAGTATTFALSNSNLTLTATVTSLSSGSPTGSVGFYVGQTLAGTGTLSNGVASFTMASFPTGNVTLTAQYSGDANFTQSSSPALFILAVTPTVSSLTVSTAGTVTDALTLAVAPGYVGTVQFSCSGLPKGTTCAFNPATASFTGSSSTANVTLTITTGNPVTAMVRRLPGVEMAGLLGIPGLLAMALYSRRKKGNPLPAALLMLVVLAGVGTVLSGCGGGTTTAPTGPTSTTPAGTSTIQVVATGSAGLSQTTNVTLNVQ